MIQISNMKVIGLTVDFKKIVELWHLSIEFYGEWQLFATHHRTSPSRHSVSILNALKRQKLLILRVNVRCIVTRHPREREELAEMAL